MSGFINFARAHGVDINPSKFFAGEKIRRCGTVDKPKSTNGAYFWDGERGWVFNWAAEARGGHDQLILVPITKTLAQRVMCSLLEGTRRWE